MLLKMDNPPVGDTRPIRFDCVSPSNERFVLVVLMLVLSCTYGILGMHFSSLHAFWSPDSGARFAMVQNWIYHRSLVHLSYPAAAVDPSGQINALSFFLFHQEHTFQPMYLPLFPFFSCFTYRVLGFGGLLIIPVFCGLATVLCAYYTARHLSSRSRLLIIPVLGLATPLAIYSVVFWDHTALMLIVAAGSYLMARSLSPKRLDRRCLSAAGAIFGIGIWFHESLAAFFVASIVACLTCRELRRKAVAYLCLGFTPIALAWMACNYWIYGTILGSHLAANMSNIGINAVDHPYGMRKIMDGSGLLDRTRDELIGPVSYPSESFPFSLIFMTILTSYLLVSKPGGAMSWITSLLSVTAAVFAFVSVIESRSATGLFQATPLLLPSLAALWCSGKHPQARSDAYMLDHPEISLDTHLFYAWAYRTCMLFVLFMLINPMLPGTDWGSRYILAILPLLVLLAAHVLDTQYASARSAGWHSVVLLEVVALVGLSAANQLAGLGMIDRVMRYNHHLNQFARTITSPVIVTDDINIGPQLQASNLSTSQFLVRRGTDGYVFLKVLRYSAATQFTWIGSDEGAESLPDVMVGRDGLFVETQVRSFEPNAKYEEGSTLQFVSFQLQTGKSLGSGFDP